MQQTTIATQRNAITVNLSSQTWMFENGQRSGCPI
jgi:hypothetical protein